MCVFWVSTWKKGYKVLNLKSLRCFVSWDVVFHELLFPFSSTKSSVPTDSLFPTAIKYMLAVHFFSLPMDDRVSLNDPIIQVTHSLTVVPDSLSQPEHTPHIPSIRSSQPTMVDVIVAIYML